MRYYFHTHDGTREIDSDGTEFERLNQARVEAVKAAAAMIGEHAETFWRDGIWGMTVENPDGLVMFRLNFSGTMAPASGNPNGTAPRRG